MEKTCVKMVYFGLDPQILQTLFYLAKVAMCEIEIGRIKGRRQGVPRRVKC